MRGKLSTLAASTLLAVSLVAGGAAPSAHAAVTKVVKMTNSNTFNPTPITIHKGDFIKWKNTASTTHHTTTSSLWNSKDMAPGATFTRKFRTTGTFRYYCKYHKSLGMTGKIIVKP